MKLNKDTKYSVMAGDILRFSANESYVVTNVIHETAWNRPTVLLTIQDTKTRQTIYAMPSSQLYGAEIIREEDGQP